MRHRRVEAVTIAGPHRILDALDDQQRQVATALGGPVVVKAGAGTGKTRALTHRIAYAVATGRYDPRAVLAVTFTTRAAGEMRGRLGALGVAGVQARTFHSAALSQVRYFWPRAMGSPTPQVLASPFGLLGKACAQAGLPSEVTLLRDLAGEIAWAKTSNVTTADYARLAALEGRTCGALEPAQVCQLMVAYERLKQAAGQMDFDDILLADVALLAQFPDIAAEVRAQYRHFLVDEYQDVSPLQHTLLRLWLGERDDLCVVGDPAQSIHAFAGAQRRYLLDFPHEFPGATRLDLVRNYRSGAAICELANRLARRAPDEVGAVQLRPVNPGGGPVEAVGYDDDAAEIAGTVAWLVAQHAAGVDWADLAVLFRINAQTPPFEAALAQAGLPYVVRDAERFYDRPEVKQALAGLRQAAALHPSEPGVAGLEAVLTGLGYSPAAPQGAGRTRERWESWQALLDLAGQIAGEGADTLAGVAAGLAERVRLQQAPSPAGVTLATMHSAKGLEWSGVALVGLREGLVPFALAKTGEQLAEERRLLYVGLTRARERLRLSWASGGANGRGRHETSRFVTDLVAVPAPAVGGAPVPEALARGTGRHVVTCRVCGGTLQAAEVKLGRHAACPAGHDEALLHALTVWRATTARAAGVPAFVVFTDATLRAIAEAVPVTPADLRAIGGVGPAKLARYGEAVLALARASHAA